MSDLPPSDAAFCRSKHLDEEPVKMRVVQSGVFIHEGEILIWRRKRCPECGSSYKTVEVPLESAQRLFSDAFRGLY